MFSEHSFLLNSEFTISEAKKYVTKRYSRIIFLSFEFFILKTHFTYGTFSIPNYSNLSII